VGTDEVLVGRLLTAQFPQWAALAIRRVRSSGTDNDLYRLGDELVVRLPRIDWAVGQVEKEQEWLPRLAPLLPLAIPLPLAKGSPGEGYPWQWSVYTWLEGRDAASVCVQDLVQTAADLSRFLWALHDIDPGGGPVPGSHNSYRGEPLANRDDATRRAIEQLHGVVDARRVTEVWESALNASPLQGPSVWIHGDMASGNLLVSQGRISAVIDFGCLGVGDPACDLLVGWSLLNAESRAVLRAGLDVDDGTWLRGRGWALSVALIALPYYRHTSPEIVRHSHRMIREVLEDYGGVPQP
jgi:aminoglycoside phosphotransferase (APT) family kinase protein